MLAFDNDIYNDAALLKTELYRNAKQRIRVFIALNKIDLVCLNQILTFYDTSSFSFTIKSKLNNKTINGALLAELICLISQHKQLRYETTLFFDCLTPTLYYKCFSSKGNLFFLNSKEFYKSSIDARD